MGGWRRRREDGDQNRNRRMQPIFVTLSPQRTCIKIMFAFLLLSTPRGTQNEAQSSKISSKISSRFGIRNRFHNRSSRAEFNLGLPEAHQEPERAVKSRGFAAWSSQSRKCGAEVLNAPQYRVACERRLADRRGDAGVANHGNTKYPLFGYSDIVPFHPGLQSRIIGALSSSSHVAHHRLSPCCDSEASITVGQLAATRNPRLGLEFGFVVGPPRPTRWGGHTYLADFTPLVSGYDA